MFRLKVFPRIPPEILSKVPPLGISPGIAAGISPGTHLGNSALASVIPIGFCQGFL